MATLRGGENKFFYWCISRSDTAHECDEQTDRQTELPLHILRLHRAIKRKTRRLLKLILMFRTLAILHINVYLPLFCVLCFMLLITMRGEGCYVFTMSRCPDVCPDVPCQHRHFFRFARILNGFRWDLREVITTTNRWTGCILDEIVLRTREKDTTENSNRRQTDAAT